MARMMAVQLRSVTPIFGVGQGMSEILTKCPKCESYHVETMTIHNPETHSMNANATLRCQDCKHEWEGKVMSPWMRENRRRGFCI